MDVLIFGGSGLIGQALARKLMESGDSVYVFSRNHRDTKYGTVVRYSTETVGEDILRLSIKEPYAIVNLAGESIAGGRWTARRKQAIHNSRVLVTQAISKAITTLPVPPAVFVSGSAVGYYGSSTTRTFTESSPSGTGFLPEVTRSWEAAARLSEDRTRVVLLRTGLVLSRVGGALSQMVLPYRLGVGGKIGTGQQWVSWIHIDDVVGIILHCINNESVQGVVNVTAPNPVVMDEFGRSVGAVLKRPHWFPVPSFVMKLVFGEMSEILLEGQRVLPNTMLHTGYHFRFTNASEALADILK